MTRAGLRRFLSEFAGIFIAGGALTCPAAAQACVTGSYGATSTGNLSFGSILTGSGGTVTIASNGSRSAIGAVPLNINAAAAYNAATFTICSLADTVAVVSLPGDSSVFLFDGHGHSMPVQSFTSSAANGSISLNSATSASLSVGATLTVAANQAPGNYSGSFEVTVTYQ